MTLSRRGFVKGVTAALPVVALPACAAPAVDASRSLDPVLLAALAESVLPTELGTAGRERALAGFQQWLAAYRPVAERDHGYGTGELTYTGADPAPGWNAQLQALDLEARQRFQRGLAEVDPAIRARLVRTQLRRERTLTEPAEAAHVALGLLSWWAASSEANDLCYGAAIGRETCRPLEQTVNQPAALARNA
jgi:hypothetical protein